jgi:tRNA(adenine34) deaminase
MNIQQQECEAYMKKALHLACKAYEEDEVPIGALIIDVNGLVIGEGYNKTEQGNSQTLHAELTALASAGKNKQDWRLDGCTIFVTLEPCSMCMNAIKLSRIKKIVYGSDSPVFGFRLDMDCFVSIYNRDVLSIQSGVLSEECSELLKKFFQKKRNDNERF